MSTPFQRKIVSRKDFLRLVGAGISTLAASQVLPACQQANPTETKVAMDTPIPTPIPASPTPAPTTPPTPTAAVVSAPIRPELIKYYPEVPSKVIETHHPGVWSDQTLSADALRQMLDESITRLTGLNDAREAWSALFRPGERIAIKVNAFHNSVIWTHVPLVKAVTDSLQEAGVPAENIVIFDYYTSELKTAGYQVNPDGSGVRCVGTESNYNSEPVDVSGKNIKLSSLLTSCDALINMPVLKSHMMAGVTFAMKNHYGSYSNSAILHSGHMKEIAALNALPEIKDRTRLIIGDALSANLRYKNSFPYWVEDWTGDSIFMGFDPVAMDTLALNKITALLEQDGGSGAALVRMATPALEYAGELGIGANDLANVQFEEVTL